LTDLCTSLPMEPEQTPAPVKRRAERKGGIKHRKLPSIEQLMLDAAKYPKPVRPPRGAPVEEMKAFKALWQKYYYYNHTRFRLDEEYAERQRRYSALHRPKSSTKSNPRHNIRAKQYTSSNRRRTFSDLQNRPISDQWITKVGRIMSGELSMCAVGKVRGK
jgi:hypothetical protein